MSEEVRCHELMQKYLFKLKNVYIVLCIIDINAKNKIKYVLFCAALEALAESQHKCYPYLLKVSKFVLQLVPIKIIKFHDSIQYACYFKISNKYALISCLHMYMQTVKQILGMSSLHCWPCWKMHLETFFRKTVQPLLKALQNHVSLSYIENNTFECHIQFGRTKKMF